MSCRLAITTTSSYTPINKIFLLNTVRVIWETFRHICRYIYINGAFSFMYTLQCLVMHMHVMMNWARSREDVKYFTKFSRKWHEMFPSSLETSHLVTWYSFFLVRRRINEWRVFRDRLKHMSYIFHGSKAIRNNKMTLNTKSTWVLNRDCEWGPIRTWDILDKFTRAIQNKQKTNQLTVNKRY